MKATTIHLLRPGAQWVLPLSEVDFSTRPEDAEYEERENPKQGFRTVTFPGHDFMVGPLRELPLGCELVLVISNYEDDRLVEQASYTFRNSAISFSIDSFPDGEPKYQYRVSGYVDLPCPGPMKKVLVNYGPE